MKYLVSLILIISNLSMSAQREIRFVDSLTLDVQRTWVQVDGSPFTNVGDDCNYGMEMTFYKKGNKVEIHECHEGEWKLSNYTYEVSSESREHFIKFYKNEKVFFIFNKTSVVDDFVVEVQMISDRNDNFSTEISYFSLGHKTTRTLRSKK